MAKKDQTKLKEQFKRLRLPCLKCGYIPFPGGTHTVLYDLSVDQLRLTCRRCNWSWFIATLDKNSPPPLPEPPEPHNIGGEN